MRPSSVVGVDLGTHSIKLVHAARRLRGVALLHSERIPAPDDPVDRAAALSTLVDKCRAWGSACCISVPRRSVMLQKESIEDFGPGHSFEEQIDEVSASPEGGAITSRLSGKGIGGDWVAVARSDQVFNGLELCEAAGLDVIGAYPPSVATFNYVANLVPREVTVFACLDIGRFSSEALVGTHQGIQSIRHVPLGSDTTDFAPRLVEDVASWLTSEEFNEGRGRPELLVLSGGGALYSGLARQLQDESGLSTVLMGQLDPTETDKPEVFAVARGLALSALVPASVSVDLLPEVVSHRKRLRMGRKYWILAAACLLLAMVPPLLDARLGLLEKQSRLLALEQERSRIEGTKAEIEALEQKSRGVETQVKPFRSAAYNRILMDIVMEALEETKDEGDWIVMVADRNSYKGLPYDSKEEDPLLSIRHIVIEGYTSNPDLSTVGKLIESLKGRKAITDADLLPEEETRQDPERDERWAETGARLFAIEITITET